MKYHFHMVLLFFRSRRGKTNMLSILHHHMTCICFMWHWAHVWYSFSNGSAGIWISQSQPVDLWLQLNYGIVQDHRSVGEYVTKTRTWVICIHRRWNIVGSCDQFDLAGVVCVVPASQASSTWEVWSCCCCSSGMVPFDAATLHSIHSSAVNPLVIWESPARWVLWEIILKACAVLLLCYCDGWWHCGEQFSPSPTPCAHMSGKVL